MGHTNKDLILSIVPLNKPGAVGELLMDTPKNYKFASKGVPPDFFRDLKVIH